MNSWKKMYRKNILNNEKIDLANVFMIINLNKTGYVNLEELKSFIYSKGLYAKKETMIGTVTINYDLGKQPYFGGSIRQGKDNLR
jgi:hypothetical protein